MTRVSAINTGQGSISQLSFVGDTADLVTAGRDGRLLRWSSGKSSLIARIDQPIERFSFVTAARSIVFSDGEATLWLATVNGTLHRMYKAGSNIRQISTLPDHQTVLVGYANGDVDAIDVPSERRRTVLHASGAIGELSFSDDGHVIAISSNDGYCYIGMWQNYTSHKITWTKFAIRVRHQAISKYGLLVILATDATIWFYSIHDGRWLCQPTSSGDLRRVALSADGERAAAVDIEGRILWIDLNAVNNLLKQQPAN